MPCYLTIKTTVELKLANHDLLKEALKAMGIEVEVNGDTLLCYDFETGTRFTITKGSGEIVSTDKRSNEAVLSGIALRIKNAYAVQCVEQLQKKSKWQVKWDTRDKVRRRGKLVRSR